MARTNPRELVATGLDAYEAAVQVLTELCWAVAGTTAFWPAASCADLTRDTTAVQLSAARWLLDL